jgi:hypothetical protein
VHNECWQAFNVAADSPVEKCKQCKHSLAPAPDRFTGIFLQMENGDKVHEECRMYVKLQLCLVTAVGACK